MTGISLPSIAAVGYRMGTWLNDQRVHLDPRPRMLATHWYKKRPNFGDAVSPVVLAHVSARTPAWVSEFRSGKVLAIGSLLHRVRPGDTVWGTGAIRNTPIDVEGVNYLAVRGPLSRSVIRGDVPEIYGDPASLLPKIYEPRISRRFEVGVVPHYMDRDAMWIDDTSISVIDPLHPWRQVVDLIASCDVIISSSLHGLIVAESYGIPAVWVSAGDRLVGGTFKFRDYYLATEREIVEPISWNRGVEAALKHVPQAGNTDVSSLVAAWQRGSSDFSGV